MATNSDCISYLTLWMADYILRIANFLQVFYKTVDNLVFKHVESGTTVLTENIINRKT